MFLLILNADTKFACKIIATFSALLHERILKILSLLDTISFSTLHTVQQTALHTVQQTVQQTVWQTIQQTVQQTVQHSFKNEHKVS